MYCTRQIKKKVLFFYFYFKANPIIWWTGVKKYNPSPSKILWTPKKYEYLTVRSAYLPEKYQKFQLSRPSTSQMK